MKWNRISFHLLFTLAFCESLFSQESAVLLPEFTYSYGIPGGDLSDRFGTHLCLGVGVTYQPAKNHFNFGTRFNYFFGSEVKEDVLKPFRTGFDGLIIGRDNYLADLTLKERGFYIQVHTGGLIPVFSQEKIRQSIKWQFGLGFIQHNIRFEDDARALSQFTDEYKEGLDRMSNGWAIIPFIGYEYLSREGWLSFYTGIEPVFGFTKNRRSLNYDTNESELGISRTDIMINFKFGLYLPLYIFRDPANLEY
jgi:hypothetical protein